MKKKLKNIKIIPLCIYKTIVNIIKVLTYFKVRTFLHMIKYFLIDHQAQGEKYDSDNSKILDNFSESIGNDFVMYFEIFSIICVPVYL